MEDSDTHPGGSGAVSGPTPSIQLGIGMGPQHVQNDPGCSTQNAERLPVDLGPSDQIAAPTLGEQDFGSCRVVEEPQDD